MMRDMKLAAVALVLLSTTACPRQVQVESEPNRLQAAAVAAPAEIDIVGVYDYVVVMGNGDVTGPMTVTRAADGSYAVSFVMDDGQSVPTRNVRRSGNTLRMDVSTPAGEGAVTLEWLDANRVEGDVFIGETLDIRATRRP